jgi:superfamily II DNA or RNA helicase
MSLRTQLAGDFDSAIVQRGTDYFRTGRVRIQVASASRVVATVRGSTRYQVGLEREAQKIRASCTCPYFDVGLCKHIWAVIVAADSQRLLQGMGRDAGIELVRREVGYDGLDEDPDGADEDEEDFEDIPWPPRRISAPVSSPSRPVTPRTPREPKAASWRKRLAQLNPAPPPGYSSRLEAWPPKRELLYVIDVANTLPGDGLYLEIFLHDLKKDGTRAKPKSQYLRREWLQGLPDPDDRHILASLAGATQLYSPSGSSYPSDYGADSPHIGSLPFRYRLWDPQPELILPAICRTGRGRLRLRAEDEEPQWLPVRWEEGEPWQFRLEVRRSQQGERYEVAGMLRRDVQRMDLSAPALLIDAGILFTQEQAARYEHHGAFNWITLLRAHGPLLVPVEQAAEFLAELLRQPQLPPLDVPEELRYEESTLAPRPRLTVKPDKRGWKRDQLQGELTFDYGGTLVAHDDPSRGVVQTPQRHVLLRDLAAERAADLCLQQLGWRRGPPTYADPEPKLELAAHRLPNTVSELTAAGWHVEAEGNVYRSPGKFDLQVRSGIDWFELHGVVEFGDTVAHLPELLAAVRRGEGTVRLGDGSFGLLPQEWLKKCGLLAALGAAHEDHLRFTRRQVGLLDALLAAQPEVQCDALFAQARDELRSFAGIQPAEPSAGFTGELRPYQKEGLGWLHFLRRFGFGGCLADDMGLGKTVQVLALLEARREWREQHRGSVRHPRRRESTRNVAPEPPLAGPSLVVVPKSLIFNWKQEAERFAPRLRVLDHTGSLRQKGNGHFEDYDVVLTTYGTLRNDAADFKDVRFDYLILDEAQAIKNADSVSAKAARLLQGDHRLAVSGTPIENHLGELWSLFEFLNPGMLGAASVFKSTHGAARDPDQETRRLLVRALRPFLLRRTKEQVVRDLPPKVEQTLYCELESKQRRLYDELRDHYRDTLLKRVERGGLGRAKIQILEALLRLRQAAIHPGLLDDRRAQESSAKLDMLLPRLREVLDEGHKTLVFSQFTGMLAILREHLDRDGIAHEYLDGKTRDRQACVERFQTAPDCRLFLISLKAGGLGLNLTAAQYVFLLDPWWNPAVEAQAIDRAHRIGQMNRVFAYRLIARGTVEEKVLELQNTKRDLADAIIGADNGLIRNLGREDLDLLLS